MVARSDNRPDVRAKALAFIAWADGYRGVLPSEVQRQIGAALEVAAAYLGETDPPKDGDGG